MKIDVYKIYAKMCYYSFQFGLFIKPVVRPILDFFEELTKKILDKPLIFILSFLDILVMTYTLQEIVFLFFPEKQFKFLIIIIYLHIFGIAMDIFAERFKYLFGIDFIDFLKKTFKKLKVWMLLRFL